MPDTSAPGGFGASHRPARPHAAGSDPWSQFRQGFKQEYTASGPTPQDFGADSWSGVAKKAGKHFAQGFRQGVARAELQRRWQNMPPPSDDPGASAPPRDGMPRPSRPHPASGPDPRRGARPQAQGRTRQGPRPAAPPAADTSSDMTRAALASMGLSEGAEAHQILGVSRSASAQEIRLAYRRQQLKHHPDRNPDSPHATRASQLIVEAYETMRAAAR